MDTGAQWSGILTGAPNSLPDLALKIKSLSAILRASTTTFISCVIATEQATDAGARPDGDIVIYRTILPDGAPVEVKRVPYVALRMDKGALSSSVVISGRTTVGFGAGAAVTAFNVEADDIDSDGLRVLTMSPLNIIKPGDTVTYNAVATLVEAVEYRVSAQAQSMVVKE